MLRSANDAVDDIQITALACEVFLGQPLQPLDPDPSDASLQSLLSSKSGRRAEMDSWPTSPAQPLSVTEIKNISKGPQHNKYCRLTIYLLLALSLTHFRVFVRPIFVRGLIV